MSLDGPRTSWSRLHPWARLAVAVWVAMTVAEFDSRRHEFIASHLKTLGIGPRARKLKVNVGCGKFPIPSWVNVDLHPAELPVSLRWGLPLPDKSAAYVFMSHAMEHLYHPGETLAIAREAALKLKETCSLHAEAFSGAEFLHGPIALVESSYPVLLFVATDQAAAASRPMVAATTASATI